MFIAFKVLLLFKYFNDLRRGMTRLEFAAFGAAGQYLEYLCNLSLVLQRFESVLTRRASIKANPNLLQSSILFLPKASRGTAVKGWCLGSHKFQMTVLKI